MRCFYVLFLFLACGGTLYAQVGIGTTSPNPNAVLELTSPESDQGFLAPRLTTAQRTALTFSTAENGLLVYDSDENKFFYWHVSQWLPVRSGYDVTLSAGPGIEIMDNIVSAVPDGDGDAANEIQDLELVGGTLTITNNSSATPIDLAPFQGTNTDEQVLNYNATTGALGISNGNTVTITSAGTAGGALTGTYPNPGLADNAVTSNKISNLAVTSGKIVDGAVGTNKIANLSVTNAKIANGTITPEKIVASGTSGQVLTTAAGAAVWADLPPIGGGTVTTIATGTGLTGGPITNTGTVSLANTTVTPGTYGSSTTVPRITVDAQGRLTSVTTASVSAGSTEDLASTLQAGADAKMEMAYNFSSVSIGNWEKGPGPGALNVNGSHYSSLVAVSDNYEVQETDYIVLGRPVEKAIFVTLPDAAVMRGRVLIFRSMSSNPDRPMRLIVSKGFIDGELESEAMFYNTNGQNIAYALTVISDGRDWWTINRAIPPSGIGKD